MSNSQHACCKDLLGDMHNIIHTYSQQCLASPVPQVGYYYHFMLGRAGRRWVGRSTFQREGTGMLDDMVEMVGGVSSGTLGL